MKILGAFVSAIALKILKYHANILTVCLQFVLMEKIPISFSIFTEKKNSGEDVIENGTS